MGTDARGHASLEPQPNALLIDVNRISAPFRIVGYSAGGTGAEYAWSAAWARSAAAFQRAPASLSSPDEDSANRHQFTIDPATSEASNFRMDWEASRDNLTESYGNVARCSERLGRVLTTVKDRRRNHRDDNPQDQDQEDDWTETMLFGIAYVAVY